jgi:hypothetical protein
MKLLLSLAIAVWISCLSGCSVYMASHQPSEKNIALFKPGTPRSFLIAEFGQPASSEAKNGTTYEIFRFTQGYSGGAKAGRAFAEGVADVLTLGAAEIITTPVESIADGNLTAYEVSYDSNNLVLAVIPLTPAASPDAPAQNNATPTPAPQAVNTPSR